jgi:hypothetical protein
MPKRQKSVRLSNGLKLNTNKKSKNIQKLKDNKRANENIDSVDFEIKTKSLFEMLFLDD